MDTLLELTKTIESHEILIKEIGDMVSNIHMTQANLEMAQVAKATLEREKLELICKAVTLKNLRFYRELKEENDLPNQS